ncbi:MAG TPA: SprT-like domain-containing protein [Chthoniobacterales bacterium]|nr:SprT-like domain-containing protein [Chthoniobacterales bacterium]
MKSPTRKPAVSNRRSLMPNGRLGHSQLDFVFPSTPSLVVLGRDAALEAKAREILCSLDAAELARAVHVEWNARLFSAAGRADFRRNLVSLNPRLREHDVAEVDRTLRHELAHLLAQFRAGRRRVPPHGAEWRKACRDLGIGDESRTHALPFPVQRRSRRLLYECPRCGKEFPRVRPIKRAVACLDCCRKFNRGKFDGSAQLRLVQRGQAT